MNLPPRPRSERLVGLELLVHSYLVNGLIEAAAGFYAFFTILSAGGWSWGAELPAGSQLHGRAVAAFFAAVVLCQAVNAVAARTRSQSLWQQGFFSNKWHMAGVVTSILMALAIIALPPLQAAFGTASLEPGELLLAWPFALGILLLDEIRRWLVRHDVKGSIRQAG